MNKKGAADWHNLWVEYLIFLLLIFGFGLSVLSRSTAVSYTVIILAGLIAGQSYAKKLHNLKVPSLLIIIGFLIGFLLGSSVQGTNPWILMILFGLSVYLGYVITKKHVRIL